MITAQGQTAMRTFMLTLPKFFENFYAAPAAFLCCASGIDCNHMTPSLFGFVRQLKEQGSPCRIQDELRKVAANHLVNFQIFMRDQVIRLQQLFRNVMTEIL